MNTHQSPSTPRTEVETYPLEQANAALVSLKRDSVRGAKVLCMEGAASIWRTASDSR